MGSRVVFDEEGNTLPPLAKIADRDNGNNLLQLDKGIVILEVQLLKSLLQMHACLYLNANITQTFGDFLLPFPMLAKDFLFLIKEIIYTSRQSFEPWGTGNCSV